MKNVNATITFSVLVEKDIKNSFSLLGVFSEIQPEKKNDQYYIPNMGIYINASIILNNEYNDDARYIQQDKIYECAIKMTHQKTERAAIIDRFDLKIDDANVQKWCKDFYEFKRTRTFQDFCLPEGLGDYSLKLLIREKTENEDARWNVQVIHSLIVGGVS